MASKAETFTKLFIGNHNYESLASGSQAGDKILSRNIVVDAFNFSYFYYADAKVEHAPITHEFKQEVQFKQDDSLFLLSALHSLSSYAIKSPGEFSMVHGVLVEDIISIHTKLQSSLRAPIELSLQGYSSESLLNLHSPISCNEFYYTSIQEYIDKMRDIAAMPDIDKSFNVQLRYTQQWEAHCNVEQMFLPLFPRCSVSQMEQLIADFHSNASIKKKFSRMKELVTDPKKMCKNPSRERYHFYTNNTIIEAVKSFRCGYHVLLFEATGRSEGEVLVNGKPGSLSLEDSVEEPFHYIKEASLIKLANRAGCLLISKLCFSRLRILLKQFVLAAVKFVVLDKKKIVLARDVEHGLSSDKVVLGYGIAGLRHFWSGTVSNGIPDSGLIAKLQQINPTKSVDSVAMSVLNDLLTWTFIQLMKDVVDTNNRETLADEDDDDEDDDDDDNYRCYCSYRRKLLTSTRTCSGLTVWLVKNFDSCLGKDIIYEQDRSVVPGSAQILKDLDGKSAKDFIPTRFVVAKNIYSAVTHILSGDLMKNAISQGYQAVSKWVESCRSSVVMDNHKRSRSIRMNSTLNGECAGIIFKPEFVALLANEMFQVTLHESCAIYLSAVLEYLITEILDRSCIIASEIGSSCITSRHLYQTIRSDSELSATYGKCVIRDGGVIPFIHDWLLQIPSDDMHFCDESKFDAVFKQALQNLPENPLVDPRDGYHYRYNKEADAVYRVIAFDCASALNRRHRMRKAIDALSFKKKLVLAEELPLLVAEGGDYSAALDMIDMRSFYNRLLTNIRTAQSEYSYCIDASSMERMIFEVIASSTSASEVRFTFEATALLHTRAEHYLQSLLEEANMIAVHSGRRIVLSVDLDLACKMSHNR